MSGRTPLDHARDLLARGLSPIPVPFKTKGPRLAGWQSLRLSVDDLPRHFNGALGNVGVLLGEPSGWIVDVDLDHARAVELADSFLPHTAMTWGRESKPRSHRLFRLTCPADTRKWTSKSAGMIVELRSTGCQTIAPGSTHPSGEAVRWDDNGEPATIEPTDLIAALDALANAVRAELGEGPPPEGIGAPVPRPGPSGPSNYGREALRREAAAVAATSEGARNDALNRAAFNVGTLIGGGELDRTDAEADLLAASESCGLSDAESRRTIASGIASGMASPRQRPAQSVTVSTTRARSASSPRRRVRGPDYKPFPTTALSGTLRRFIEQTAERMNIDPVFLAGPTLSAAAGAIGNTCKLVVNGQAKWYEHAAIWTGTVALPSSIKTPSQREALKPAQDVQRTLDAAYAEQEAEYERAARAYEAANRGRKLAADAPERPTKPPRPQRILGNATWESAAHVCGANPRGVVCVHDELAGFFGSFGAYKQGKLGGEPGGAFYKSAWSGETYIENRKGAAGSGGTYLRVESTLASVCGTIQPQTLTRVLAGQYIEDGTASRFLWAAPPDAPVGWVDECEGDDVAGEWSTLYGRLGGIPMRVDPIHGQLKPFYLGLSHGAKSVARDWVNDLAERMACCDAALRAAMGKLKGYGFRFALVFHIADWADAGGSGDFDSISAATLKRGFALADWYAGEAERIYGRLGESESDTADRELVELIRRKGTRDTCGLSMSGRELVQASRRFDKVEDAEAALSRLADAGDGSWVMPEQRGRGGPKARRLVLSPHGGVNVYRNTAGAIGIANPVDVDSVDNPPNAGNEWGEM